jgi:hypothetical protein
VKLKTSQIGTGIAIALVVFPSTAAYPCGGPPVALQIRGRQQVEEVVSHLVGVMDTSAQAQANPKAPKVRITTCKIAVSNPDLSPAGAVFLYQEQALLQNLSKPYRQRFLRISPSKELQVESAGFKPANPKSWVGFCQQPEEKRIVQINDLGTTECSVFLKREGENYIGETQPGGCPTNYKGAVRITNRIVLHRSGMDTLDRGFDAAGNLVWGAKDDEPYQFRWVK